MTVGVIGAGISGLATTHELRERGVDVETFEATDRPGGVVQTRHVDGHVLECGPQRLRGSPLIESWIDEFDLRDQRFEGHDDQPLFVLRDSYLQVAPLSPGVAVTTDSDGGARFEFRTGEGPEAQGLDPVSAIGLVEED